MLSPGARLGALEILELLGAGGMGEVYRALDTRLGRDVAVKVLPDAVASDADRRARLEREARVVASLHHPNIAAIHSFEYWEGHPLLVMELVEGPTLAERALPFAGDRKPRPWLRTRFHEGGAVLSPDGHWLAYTSNESGRFEVYVRPCLGADRYWQVSTDGGRNPRWSSLGRELVYLNQGRIRSAAVTPGPHFIAAAPRALFTVALRQDIAWGPPAYAVTPDGERFLTIQNAASATRARLVIVPNWLDELRANVPSRSW
jgi:hypothetical protein